MIDASLVSNVKVLSMNVRNSSSTKGRFDMRADENLGQGFKPFYITGIQEGEKIIITCLGRRKRIRRFKCSYHGQTGRHFIVNRNGRLEYIDKVEIKQRLIFMDREA